MTARSICDMIADEHPQVIAIILSVLEDETAADVLDLFAACDSSSKVIRRIKPLLDTVQPNAMAELETVMAKQFKTSTTSSAAVGGVKAAANIIGKTKLDIETSVMADISGEDEDLAERIADNMFVFDMLVDLDNRSIQILMRTLEQEQMAYALKAALEPVVEKFMANMSQRQGAMFLDEMEQMGMVRVTDADAQRDIIRQARNRKMRAITFLASADGGGFVQLGKSQFVTDPVLKAAKERQPFFDSQVLANPSFTASDDFISVVGAKALGVTLDPETGRMPVPEAEVPEVAGSAEFLELGSSGSAGQDRRRPYRDLRRAACGAQ